MPPPKRGKPKPPPAKSSTGPGLPSAQHSDMSSIILEIAAGGDQDAVDEPQAPKVLPFDQMQPNPENPRPTGLEIDEMAADLRDRGQLQNVNVMTLTAFLEQKPHLADKLTDAPYVVINGCCRLASGPKSGLEGLKYEVRDEWSEDQIDEAMIAENEHRLALNPLLLGRHLARMLPRYVDPTSGKPSERQLAKKLNKNHNWVNQRIKLTKLHPALQKVIEADADQIPFKLTRECGRLHEQLQPELAAGNLPVEVAQAWIVQLRLPADEQLRRWEAGEPFDVGVYPVDTADDSADPVAKQEKKPRGKPAIVIRLAERDLPTLATALRDQLTDDEVGQLVDQLTAPH